MITKHANQRMTERAISPVMVDLLYLFGAERHQNGSTVLYFDQKSRRRARKALEDTLRRFDKQSDAYVVRAADSGDTITVGHRTKRLRNK